MLFEGKRRRLLQKAIYDWRARKGWQREKFVILKVIKWLK